MSFCHSGVFDRERPSCGPEISMLTEAREVSGLKEVVWDVSVEFGYERVESREMVEVEFIGKLDEGSLQDQEADCEEWNEINQSGII
jgi:hypothetical protein